MEMEHQCNRPVGQEEQQPKYGSIQKGTLVMINHQPHN